MKALSSLSRARHKFSYLQFQFIVLEIKFICQLVDSLFALEIEIIRWKRALSLSLCFNCLMSASRGFFVLGANGIM
jgi:hypothetical protein